MASIDDPFVDADGNPQLIDCGVLYVDLLGVSAMTEAQDPQHGPEVLAGLVTQGARLQLDLALKGFFMRGGFAVGLFHDMEDIVFGPALVEAHRLEQDLAVSPRVVLSDHAADCLRDCDAPLLLDQDGRAFIDYLAPAFDDASIDIDSLLTSHRRVIARRLEDHRSSSRKWGKYRWVADYHNAICARRRPKSPKLLIDVGATDRRFAKFA